MIVTPVKTGLVLSNSISLFDLINRYLSKVPERSIVAISSKIVSLCEGRIAPIEADRETLVQNEADFYLPPEFSQYGWNFALTHNTLIASAGIDKSNGNGDYVLWPKDPQKTANQIRKYLSGLFDLKKIGVIITDSTCLPLRRGTIGIVLAHSGFLGLKDYRQTPDLFGHPFKVSSAGLASGLAATATLVMGEGTEQTPMAVISNVPFIKFQTRNPTKKELAELYVSRDEDLFAPFLNSVRWLRGNGSKDEQVS